MHTVPWILAVLLLVVMSYWAVPLWGFALGYFCLLAGTAFVFHTPLIAAWVAYGLIFGFLFIRPIRRQLFSRWLLLFVKKQMPPISATEQAAIDAGDVWWEGNLFRGQPDWSILKRFKTATLTQEEKAFIENQTEQLCAAIDTWKTQESKALQQSVWDMILRERFFAMLIPKKYGGLAFGALAQSTIVSKIASRDASVAVTVMVPNSLGPAELLLKYGTEDQKNYYLPRLAKGEDIPCFGLTGPEAGSDAGSMIDNGVVCYGEHEGNTVLGLKLNFSKRYITLAPVATLVGLAFKCFDPEKLLSDKLDLGITLALIPASHPGVETGPRNYPIGSSFPNGTVKGKDVFIPLSFIIGGADRIGQGWRMLMECLSEGRGISLPALATATCKVSTRATGAYARVRKQFKVPIGEFEGVAERLARIGGLNYMVEAMRVLTASAIQSGKRPSVVSAIAKYHMTEMARTAVSDAMDIHGGRAVMMGPSNYLANGYIVMPVAITVEGANILTRNLIVFGQGAIRCHPYLLDEIHAATQHNLKAFDQVLFKHMAYTTTNGIRTLIQGLTGGQVIVTTPSGELGYYYQQLTRMSTALAFIADKTLMMLGGKLKRKENLSARLGDIMSYLYIASSVIKYYESTERAQNEKSYVQWSLEYCLANIQQAFDAFFDNFPVPIIGWLFKKMVFPYGRAYRMPSDKRSHMLVTSLLHESPMRAKLTQDIFVGDKDEPVGMVEYAMIQEHDAKSALHKIKDAIREKKIKASSTLEERIRAAQEKAIISSEEAKQLDTYAHAYHKAIAVDDFDTPAIID